MRTWILVGAGAAAAVLAIVATGLGWWSGSASGGGTPAPRLAVRTSLERSAVLYGDPLAAEVDVDYDTRGIASGGIRVQPDFLPYVATSAPEIRQARTGHTAVLRYRYSLLCVAEGCLPTNGPRQVKLKPVKVTGVSGNQTVTSSAQWPLVVVASRLSQSDRSGPIHFRHSAAPPAPEFAVAPGPLAYGLIGAAGLFTLAAAALVGRELARLRGRVRARKLTSLELALSYARDSALRPDPGDRRKALELLAEAVEGGGEPALARSAAETAWSQEPPTPARTVELADEVDRARQEIR
jgi:hypothetical protein